MAAKNPSCDPSAVLDRLASKEWRISYSTEGVMQSKVELVSEEDWRLTSGEEEEDRR